MDDASVVETFVEVFWHRAFARSLVSTVVGAGFALAIALWLFGRSRAGENKTRGQRRQALALALADRLEAHLEPLRPFESADLEAVRLAWMDTAALEATAGLKYELLDDIGLSVRIDELLSTLLDVNRLQALSHELSFETGHTLGDAETLRKGVIIVLAEHAVLYRERAADVIEKLRAIAGPR